MTVIKLGKYKNCIKKFKRYGLSQEEAEIACARLSVTDDEWTVENAIKERIKEKTGFEVEELEEEDLEIIAKRKKLMEQWKLWTPAGGKAAGVKEPEKRRPITTVPLPGQLPLFQPWRALKSQHRLQTKLEKLQTEEQKYLTSEQLQKRAEYAVSIKKRDSGELEIILPALIIDEMKKIKDPTKGLKKDIPSKFGAIKGYTKAGDPIVGYFKTGSGKGAIPLVIREGKVVKATEVEGKAPTRQGKAEKPKEELGPAGLIGGKSFIENLKGRVGEKIEETRLEQFQKGELDWKKAIDRGVAEMEPIAYGKMRSRLLGTRVLVEPKITGSAKMTRLQAFLKSYLAIDRPTGEYETIETYSPPNSYEWLVKALMTPMDPKDLPQDQLANIIATAPYEDPRKHPSKRLKEQKQYEHDVEIFKGNLVYQLMAATYLTGTDEIIHAFEKSNNHYVREILVDKLRKKSEGDLPDPTAKKYIKELDEARAVWTTGPEKGQLRTPGSRAKRHLRIGKTQANETLKDGKNKVKEWRQSTQEALIDMENRFKKGEGATEYLRALTGKPPSEETLRFMREGGRAALEKMTAGLKAMFKKKPEEVEKESPEEIITEQERLKELLPEETRRFKWEKAEREYFQKKEEREQAKKNKKDSISRSTINYIKMSKKL